MVDELAEGLFDGQPLSLAALVEGDLLGVGDDSRVDEPQLALEVLLLDCHGAHRGTEPEAHACVEGGGGREGGE